MTEYLGDAVLNLTGDLGDLAAVEARALAMTATNMDLMARKVDDFVGRAAQAGQLFDRSFVQPVLGGLSDIDLKAMEAAASVDILASSFRSADEAMGLLATHITGDAAVIDRVLAGIASEAESSAARVIVAAAEEARAIDNLRDAYLELAAAEAMAARSRGDLRASGAIPLPAGGGEAMRVPMLEQGASGGLYSFSGARSPYGIGSIQNPEVVVIEAGQFAGLAGRGAAIAMSAADPNAAAAGVAAGQPTTDLATMLALLRQAGFDPLRQAQAQIAGPPRAEPGSSFVMVGYPGSPPRTPGGQYAPQHPLIAGPPPAEPGGFVQIGPGSDPTHPIYTVVSAGPDDRTPGTDLVRQIQILTSDQSALMDWIRGEGMPGRRALPYPVTQGPLQLPAGAGPYGDYGPFRIPGTGPEPQTGPRVFVSGAGGPEQTERLDPAQFAAFMAASATSRAAYSAPLAGRPVGPWVRSTQDIAEAEAINKLTSSLGTITAADAANRLGVPIGRVHQAASAGLFPGASKEGGQWNIPEQVVVDMVTSGGGGGGGGGGILGGVAAGAAGGGGGGGGGGMGLGAILMSLLWGHGHASMLGRGRFGLGVPILGAGFGSLGSFAGLGPEHLLMTGLGIAGSATTAAAGAGVLAAGAGGQLAVGAGSNALVMASTIADTKTLGQALTQLTTAQQSAASTGATYQEVVKQFGPHSQQAVQALQNYQQALGQVSSAQSNLSATTAGLGNTVGVAAELQLAKNAQALDATFDKTSGYARVQATNILEQGVQLGSVFLPQIIAAATTNLSIIDTSIKPLFAWLEGPQGLQIWNNLEDNFRQTLPTSIDAGTNAIEGILRVISLASNYTGGFMDELDKLSREFNSMSSIQFQSVIGHLVDDFRDWEMFAKALGQDLYLLFSEDAATGQHIIVTLTGMLDKLGDWEKSVQGRTDLHTLFSVHLAEVEQLLRILPLFVNAFSPIYMTLAPELTGAFTDVAKSILDVVQALEKIPGGTWVLGLTLILAKLSLLGPALTAVGRGLGILGAGEEVAAAGTTATAVGGAATAGAAGTAERTGAAGLVGGAAVSGVRGLGGLLARLPGFSTLSEGAATATAGAFGTAAYGAEAAGFEGLAEAITGAGIAVAPVAAGLVPLLAAAGGVYGVIKLIGILNEKTPLTVPTGPAKAPTLGDVGITSQFAQTLQAPGGLQQITARAAGPLTAGDLQQRSQFGIGIKPQDIATTKEAKDALDQWVKSASSAATMAQMNVYQLESMRNEGEALAKIFPANAAIIDRYLQKIHDDTVPLQNLWGTIMSRWQNDSSTSLKSMVDIFNSSTRLIATIAGLNSAQGRQAMASNVNQMVQDVTSGMVNGTTSVKNGMSAINDAIKQGVADGALTWQQGLTQQLDVVNTLYQNHKISTQTFMTDLGQIYKTGFSDIKSSTDATNKAMWDYLQSQEAQGFLTHSAMMAKWHAFQQTSNATAKNDMGQFADVISAAFANATTSGATGMTDLWKTVNSMLKALGAPPLSALQVQVLSQGPGFNASVQSASGYGLPAGATGMMVNHPMYVVGEEAPQHPEYVLSTNPRDRAKNVGLWAQAGAHLQIPGFAGGGIPTGEPTLSYSQLESLWISAGGPPGAAALMAAIAEAESGGRDVVNSIGATGYWQIHPGGPQYLVPLTNAQEAVAKYDDGRGLDAWVTYTTGAYKQFLNGANVPAIVGGAGGGGGISLPPLVIPTVSGKGEFAAMIKSAVGLAGKDVTSFMQTKESTLAPPQAGIAGAPVFPVASGAVPAVVQRALSIALGEVGKPYVTGGYGVNAMGLDCSGLVSTVLNAVGLDPAGHLLTGGLKSWGQSGPGKFITVGVWGADSGPMGHTMMEIDGTYVEAGGNADTVHTDSGWSMDFTTWRHPQGLAGGGVVGEPGHQMTEAQFRKLQDMDWAWGGKWAGGGMMTATRPTMAMFGENGPETAMFMPHYATGTSNATGNYATQPYSGTNPLTNTIQSHTSAEWQQIWNTYYARPDPGFSSSSSSKPAAQTGNLKDAINLLGILIGDVAGSHKTLSKEGLPSGGAVALASNQIASVTAAGLTQITDVLNKFLAAATAGQAYNLAVAYGNKVLGTRSAVRGRGVGTAGSAGTGADMLEGLGGANQVSIENTLIKHALTGLTNVFSNQQTRYEGANTAVSTLTSLKSGTSLTGTLGLNSASFKALGIPEGQAQALVGGGPASDAAQVQIANQQIAGYQQDQAKLQTLYKEALKTHNKNLQNSLLTELSQVDQALMTAAQTGAQAAVQLITDTAQQFANQASTTANAGQLLTTIQGLNPGDNLGQMGLTPAVLAGMGLTPSVYGQTGTGLQYLQNLMSTTGAPLSSAQLAGAQSGVTSANALAQTQMGQLNAELAYYQSQLPNLSGSDLTNAQQAMQQLAQQIVGLQGTIETNNQSLQQLIQANIQATDAVYANTAAVQGGGVSILQGVGGLNPGTNLASLGLTPAVLQSLGVQPGLNLQGMEGTSSSYISYLQQQQNNQLTPTQLEAYTQSIQSINAGINTQIGTLTSELQYDYSQLPALAGTAGYNTMVQTMEGLAANILQLNGNVVSNNQALATLTQATNENTTATGQMTGTVAYSYQSQTFLASDTTLNLGVGG